MEIRAPAFLHARDGKIVAAEFWESNNCTTVPERGETADVAGYRIYVSIRVEAQSFRLTVSMSRRGCLRHRFLFVSRCLPSVYKSLYRVLKLSPRFLPRSLYTRFGRSFAEITFAFIIDVCCRRLPLENQEFKAPAVYNRNNLIIRIGNGLCNDLTIYNGEKAKHTD